MHCVGGSYGYEVFPHWLNAGKDLIDHNLQVGASVPNHIEHNDAIECPVGVVANGYEGSLGEGVEPLGVANEVVAPDVVECCTGAVRPSEVEDAVVDEVDFPNATHPHRKAGKGAPDGAAE